MGTPAPDSPAEAAARRALVTLCAAYAPQPTTPLWHRLAWALLCPEA